MALYDPREYPEAPVSPVADKLDAAAALIGRGWCQHALEHKGNVCALGALNEALTGHPYRLALGHAAYGALKMAAGIEFDIAGWNNAPERTQAEVIAAFRKAADMVRAGEIA